MSASSRKRSSRRPSHPKSQESSTSQPEPTWPVMSFLFTVNTLTLNEEPTNGGVAPRVDDHGRWLPPLYRAGFGQQIPGTVYRWENGVISQAIGYEWYRGAVWSSHGVTGLHRANTLFYCNPFDQFLATEGNAIDRDMANSPVPNNRWYTLNFRHQSTLSRLDLGGPEPYLAGPVPHSINQLGLNSWYNPEPLAPPSSGLSGNLALLIALVAFSCRSERLDTVLRTSWRHYEWRGHNHSNGRYERRGVVVNIYYDPENPTNSTEQTLSYLEWAGGSLLR
ncbi:hypothetical protein LSUB1_G004750 [Lachnellula subtilissima]|uniref:Uncharacterized protein n=1 Tax=Lachnellula subtilissima TaxID=602034 RepID=A0A8H8RPQ2_9HELO|nr:hypothetical protein LSUB1_G004750 [Lachnellula subtilissima]